MAREEDSIDETRMTLGEHLDELRKRLVRGGLAVGLVFIVAWTFYDELAQVLWEPHYKSVEMLNQDRVEEIEEDLAADPTLDPGEFFVDPDAEPRELLDSQRLKVSLQATHPSESFLFALKISLYVALFGGSPVLLWELWQFIAAGLYRHERRATLRYFPLSAGLFVGGVVFGYFLMMPYAMYFLGGTFELDLVENNYKVSDYASMLFQLCFALAVVFQLPVIILFAARLGLIEPKTLGRYRGHFAVGSFVIAAILTPPDPFTQSLMALPMIVLYEFGILLARWTGRERVRPDDLGCPGPTTLAGPA